MGQKLLHLQRHSQKICNPQPKNFQVQSRRLAVSFEGLISSLAQLVEETLVRQPKNIGFRLISRYDIFVDRLSRC